MKVLILLFIFILNTAFAAEVNISIYPKEPVVGESFNVSFKVISKNGTDPIINFNPGPGLEVTGRDEAGVTTSTSYINGHLSVERSVTIVYEMIATTAGSKYLRNVRVDINGEQINHKNIRIPILKTAKKPKNIMAIAEVDKEEAFVGESILVRYYLYNRVTVNTTDIKKFPKLDKFLKRYHQERMVAQKVRYNGEIYTRRVLYTAQLFADKAGNFKIDPITLKIQYYPNRANSYSSLGIGLGLRRQMSTTVTSKPIKIRIKKLPVDTMPPNFTGLVGKHEFKLTQNKNKFLVNDPIELNFSVKGKGALELFEAPNFLDNPAIEEFDATSDLTIANDFTATKTFKITHLGRAAVKIPETKIPLSYFDPETLKYITEYVELKPILVAGSGQFVPSRENKRPQIKKGPIKSPIPRTLKRNLTPIYKLSNSYIYSSKYINMILIVIFLIASGFGITKYLNNKVAKENDLIKEIKSDGADFGRLYSLISLLGNGHDMRDILDNSQLDKITKKVLLNLVDKCEKDYAKNGISKKYKIKSKHLNNIVKFIDEKDEALS